MIIPTTRNIMPARTDARILSARAFAAAVLLAASAATLSLAAAPPPAPAAQLTRLNDAQRTAILALYQKAVEAGMPDATNGTLVVGWMTTREPLPKNGLLRNIFRQPSVANNTLNTTYDRTIHLRFANGSWLLALSDSFQTDATHALAVGDGLVETTAPALASVLAQGPAKVGGSGGWMPDPLPAMFTAADIPRFEACVEAAKPFTRTGIDPDSIASLQLLRLGVAEADALLVVAGAHASYESILPLRRTLAPPLTAVRPLNLSDSPAMPSPSDLSGFANSVPEHLGKLSITAPETVASQILAKWFSDRLAELQVEGQARVNDKLTAAKAAEAVLAFSPAEERDALRPILDLLVARLALPAKAAADADLPTRLQSWEPPSQEQLSLKSMPEFKESTIASLPEKQQKILREMMARKQAALTWQPVAADIRPMIELLEDPRPSRWLDGQTPRTLGDNALRALKFTLGFDPRLLVDRKTNAPWTAEERHAAGAALQTWAKGLEGKPLFLGMSGLVGKLPLYQLSGMLSKQPAEERTAFLDAIVAAWTATPPLTQSPAQIAGILALAVNHPGMTALVNTWKPEGKLRPLLACWRDRHDDPALLNTLIDELAAVPPAADAKDPGPLGFALAESLRSPSPARLQRILALAREAPGDGRTWAVLSAVARSGLTAEGDWAAVKILDGNDGPLGAARQPLAGAERAAYLSVACAFLDDHRAIPDAAIRFAAGDAMGGSATIAGVRINFARPQAAPGTPAPAGERQPPQNLRVCDLAAAALTRNLWAFKLPASQPQLRQRLDLWATLEERDRMLQPITDAFNEDQPDTLPGAAPAKDKNAF